jgi:transposase
MSVERTPMYLKCHVRKKDGKEHRYWSILEKRRCAGGRTVDRQVLYLGEINDTQRQSWERCVDVFDTDQGQQRRLALYPEDRAVPEHAADYGVQVRLREFSLRRPRQWGACWAFFEMWKQLHLDRFWRERLEPSREGTEWYEVLVVLTAYRLIDPGSEWRLHRYWYDRSAMGDLLGTDFAVAAKDTLYRTLDQLLVHKEDLFRFLRGRWEDLFGVKFEVLLYDLTSTYFESDPPFGENDKRRHGYSRDHRPDCVQMVIALVVTVEGFPLAYEVMAGNTVDNSTLKGFLEKIERMYGTAERIWVMDRGIPTEEVLGEMRASGRVRYVVGTPKGRLTRLESALLERPWESARPSVNVKLLPQQNELYVYVQSQARVSKERAMRRRQLKKLWKRLHELQKQRPGYEALIGKIAVAQHEAGRTAALVEIVLPEPPPKNARSSRTSFRFALNKEKLRQIRRREGRYLLRTNLTGTDPAKLWEFYLQLVEVEGAFKCLKDDLAVRPVFHQREDRIEAHIFVAFLAYCVQASLRHKLRLKAPGLTVRELIDKLGAIQMLDVHFPTTDGRELVFTRYTQPEPEHQMLLDQLAWALPSQPPPRITAKRDVEM